MMHKTRGTKRAGEAGSRLRAAPPSPEGRKDSQKLAAMAFKSMSTYTGCKKQINGLLGRLNASILKKALSLLSQQIGKINNDRFLEVLKLTHHRTQGHG